MKATGLLMAGVLSLVSAAAAFAADIPPAYDATYSITDNHGNAATTHKLSDGAGRTRTETTINGGKTITIVDLNTMMVYTILESQKIITRGHYKADSESEGATLMQDLGVRNISGHLCLGKVEAVKGGLKETWTDKIQKIMVQSIFSGGSLKRTTNLTALTMGAPSADNFTLPTSGYTIMDRP
ncbi:MAG: hypothetical protein JSS86_14870 [Cyanobacteria bacterium SZAS LIN-2]|nr:hypothetical protein [Cyanobacteria bacterium SZAS LIN-2]